MKNTHTCEQRQLVLLLQRSNSRYSGEGRAVTPSKEIGTHAEKAHLIIHLRVSPCMTIYQGKCLCKYIHSAPVYPCNNNLSGKTETTADCLVSRCCLLSCLPPSVSYLVLYAFVGKSCEFYDANTRLVHHMMGCLAVGQITVGLHPPTSTYQALLLYTAISM